MVCTLNYWNGNDLFNLDNGTYYLSIEFSPSELNGLLSTLSLASNSYIETLSNQTYWFLQPDLHAVAAPGPGTLLLTLSGIAGLFVLRMRRARISRR